MLKNCLTDRTIDRVAEQQIDSLIPRYCRQTDRQTRHNYFNFYEIISSPGEISSPDLVHDPLIALLNCMLCKYNLRAFKFALGRTQ